MERRVLEITIKDLEANIQLLKAEQKESSKKLKVKLDQIEKLDSDIISKTETITLEASKLEETRRFLTQKQQEIEAREERSKVTLKELEVSIVLASEELKKLIDTSSKTAYSTSQSLKLEESLKTSIESLKTKENELILHLKTLQKDAEIREKDVNKLGQNLLHLNNETSIRTADLRLIERKIKELNKEIKKLEELRDKTDNDYKYYMDMLQTKQHDVTIVVKRLEEKYGEAFPNLKLKI